MRIRLLKAHTPHTRKLKKGTEMRVTSDYGRELIEKGIAELMDGYTKAEIETVEALIDEQEDTPKIKKVTPKEDK